MKSLKIELENKIFFRADTLRVPVYGVNGQLRVFSADGYLQALVNVYNRFFRRENRLFAREVAEDLRAFYNRSRLCLPTLKRPFGVPFFLQDFQEEITSFSYERN